MGRLLIVDDEAHVVRVTRLAVERAGWETEVARDGEEALEKLRAAPFDAVVTDITMPRMNGVRLCRAIREELGLREMPILVMTSRAEDEFRDWADGGPNIGFLEKPVSLRRLVAELSRLCGDGEPAA